MVMHYAVCTATYEGQTKYAFGYDFGMWDSKLLQYFSTNSYTCEMTDYHPLHKPIRIYMGSLKPSAPYSVHMCP